MSHKNKVVWMEGMFLRPQHFQQQERYLEEFMRLSGASDSPFSWGFRTLTLDQGLLESGQIALQSASGLFADRTPFSFPDWADPPPPLALEPPDIGCTVHLALASPVYGSRNFDGFGDGGDSRYVMHEESVRDSVRLGANEAPLDLARFRLRLLPERTDRKGYQCLAVARVAEIRANRQAILDPTFIPPALDCQINKELISKMELYSGKVQARATDLRNLATTAGRGLGEMTNFLLLQMFNRAEMDMRHLKSLPQLHPERLYAYLTGLLGEFSTFTDEARRPPELPPYNHDNLTECFTLLFAALERAFTAYIPEPVERLPVDGPFEDGIYVSEIKKRELLNHALFVLVAQADVPRSKLLELPGNLKVATIDTIRDCVDFRVGGIEFEQLTNVPRQLPAKDPAIYLALDSKSEGWRDLSDAEAFAFHVAGSFPKLNLEFWAIRTMRY